MSRLRCCVRGRYLDDGGQLELVAALADVGDVGKDLALLFELAVFALGRRLLVGRILVHAYNILSPQEIIKYG